MTEHPSHETLQLLADGELDGNSALSVRRHLDLCATCAATFASLVSFDRLMRTAPNVSPGREFTQRVLSRLGIQPKVPWHFRMLEHAASIVGVLLVAGMAAAVWIVLAQTGEVGKMQQELPGQILLDDAGRWMENAYAVCSGWLTRIVRTALGSQAGKITVMIVLMVPLVVFVDWRVRRKGAAGRM
jgi:anti-sigma factor RsiW